MGPPQTGRDASQMGAGPCRARQARVSGGGIENHSATCTCTLWVLLWIVLLGNVRNLISIDGRRYVTDPGHFHRMAGRPTTYEQRGIPDGEAEARPGPRSMPGAAGAKERLGKFPVRPNSTRECGDFRKNL